MRTVITFAAAMVTAAAGAQTTTASKPIKPVLIDHSIERLIDAKTARAILADNIPARVWKLYPASKWGWASQVEGGMTGGNVCVVTARAMMAPLTVAKHVIFKPEKMATTFDAIPNATAEQCQKLARDKLKEAVEGVVSSLVKT